MIHVLHAIYGYDTMTKLKNDVCISYISLENLFCMFTLSYGIMPAISFRMEQSVSIKLIINFDVDNLGHLILTI